MDVTKLKLRQFCSLLVVESSTWRTLCVAIVLCAPQIEFLVTFKYVVEVGLYTGDLVSRGSWRVRITLILLRTYVIGCIIEGSDRMRKKLNFNFPLDLLFFLQSDLKAIPTRKRTSVNQDLIKSPQSLLKSWLTDLHLIKFNQRVRIVFNRWIRSDPNLIWWFISDPMWHDSSEYVGATLVMDEHQSMWAKPFSSGWPFLNSVFHLRKKSLKVKKEDILLVESDVNVKVTLHKYNVFFFHFERLFSQV